VVSVIDWFNQLLIGDYQVLRPELGWLPLVVVTGGLVLAMLWLQLRSRRGVVHLGSGDSLARIVSPSGRWWRIAVIAAVVAGMFLLAIAVMNPARTGLVPKEQATVMMVLDLSGSMNQTDAGEGQTRLEAAVAASEQFVRELPDVAMVGLTVYSSVDDVEVLVSPRQDRAPLLTALSELKADGGTAIGEGILTGVQALADFNAGAGYSPELQPPSVMVLLSDGSWDTGIRPQAALAEIGSNVAINTVSFGSGGDQLDPATMERIADTTGGRYFSAENAAELGLVYEQLRDQVGYELVLTSVAHRYALFGGGLLVLANLIGLVATRSPIVNKNDETKREEAVEWTTFAA
jgi:Ca-activated chloride channel family protein